MSSLVPAREFGEAVWYVKQGLELRSVMVRPLGVARSAPPVSMLFGGVDPVGVALSWKNQEVSLEDVQTFLVAIGAYFAGHGGQG